MRLERVRGTCNDGKTCPTLFRTDRGTVVVQGWTVTDPELLGQVGAVPDGETLVEVPAALVAEVLARAE
jgi:hypothetical protein